jgi:hypothetical protein
MPFADLPSQGKRSAPSFNGGAEELGRYFSELEALFTRHTITGSLFLHRSHRPDCSAPTLKFSLRLNKKNFDGRSSSLLVNT